MNTTTQTLYIDRSQRILCGDHAHPSAATRKSLGFKPFDAAKYHPADVAMLARASGGVIGCETCRAIAARSSR